MILGLSQTHAPRRICRRRSRYASMKRMEAPAAAAVLPLAGRRSRGPSHRAHARRCASAPAASRRPAHYAPARPRPWGPTRAAAAATPEKGACAGPGVSHGDDAQIHTSLPEHQAAGARASRPPKEPRPILAACPYTHLGDTIPLPLGRHHVYVGRLRVAALAAVLGHLPQVVFIAKRVLAHLDLLLPLLQPPRVALHMRKLRLGARGAQQRHGHQGGAVRQRKGQWLMERQKGKRRPRKAAPCRVRHALPRRSKRGHILWGDCDQRARRETWKRAAQRLPRAPTSPSCRPWKRVECPLRLQSAALGHPAAQQHAVGVKAEARRAFEVCSALEAAHLPRRAAASLRCIWLPRQPQRCGAKPRRRRRHGPPGQQPDLCPE